MEPVQVCFACKKNSGQVRIIDAVKESRPVKVCEGCSRIENVILIRKPSPTQLQGANKSTSVYTRLQKLAGLSDKEHEKQFKVTQMFDNAPTRKSVIGEGDEYSQYSIKKRQEMMQKLGGPVQLVDHANWVVQKERRARRMTIKQVADAVKVSEADIKLFEDGKMPQNVRGIAEKLEQYLHIKLIKDNLRSPGFNKAAVYRSTTDYAFTRPSYSREPNAGVSAEKLVEAVPAEKEAVREKREERNYKSPIVTRQTVPSRPLPTTKSMVNTPTAHASVPLNAGASSNRITNRTQAASAQASSTKPAGIPMNAGATSNRITNRQPLSLAADALKTQSNIGQTRPTQEQYSKGNTQTKPYMVPNPSKVPGGSSGRPTLSIAEEAIKNAQNIPRVQQASRMQIGRENSNDVTISQLQDIKKEKERLTAAEREAKNAGDWKGEIEFVDLDEE
jgi:ribosome-binding protein aMBF1 (putative translation factor)